MSPPAEVEGPTAAVSESDQGCEPTTPAAEGTETEDWLIIFSAELLSPAREALKPLCSWMFTALHLPCSDVEPQVSLRPLFSSLLCPSTCQLRLAPPIFGSTRDPRPYCSTGFPCSTGSPLVSHQSTSATDLRPVLCAPSLHPYGCHVFTTSLSSSKATSLVIVITIRSILSRLCSV